MGRIIASKSGRFPRESPMVKNLPAMQETQVQSLGQEDLLEEEMATHSNILACGQRSLVSCCP